MKLKGQGRGIIMEVTRPLLLGPFYLVKWPVNPNILAASVYATQMCMLCIALIETYTANVYRDLRGLCGEIGVQGFQNCRVYMYVCILHKYCRCAIYRFCGETISPKSVCNIVQIMWVLHIKLTGKPCIVLIFQQFQLISSEFAGISL